MGTSEAWDDIQPAIRTNQSKSHTNGYLALPYNIVDTLIDAAEENFKDKGYNQADIQRFCEKFYKNYARKNGYTFKGIESVIKKVVSYFHENRTNIASARERYPELVAELLPTGDELKYLPGGICNRVHYLLSLEHYRSHKESIAPGENQE